MCKHYSYATDGILLLKIEDEMRSFDAIRNVVTSQNTLGMRRFAVLQTLQIEKESV